MIHFVIIQTGCTEPRMLTVKPEHTIRYSIDKSYYHRQNDASEESKLYQVSVFCVVILTFEEKYIIFSINMQFAYNNFISCQATHSSSCLFKFRI